ncbi:hypothetical protein E5163_09625 [Marinicauda algicola]|uniref:DUF2219 family protein n=1 Tax=Marinicauda algicola TaxID=2029849 RepID=A0A4S2GZ45_9PROT|nr:hypothetical protein [Marinicauda algicola]TGY88092.1 hypothetical protein E5163_09625 [Marinicauda algicola]
MTVRRTVEIGLAGLISLTAGVTAFTPLSQAGLADMSARDMMLAGFESHPAAPLAEATRAVVGTLMSVEPAEPAQEAGLGFRPRSDGPAALVLSADQIDLAVVPRISATNGDGESRRVMGFSVTAEPATDGQRWWLVAGAERETYVVAPDSGFRDLNLSQVGGSAAVGDAHIGIAFEVTEGAYASVGYVQQRRHFQLGTEDWEEQDHFIGATFRARW